MAQLLSTNVAGSLSVNNSSVLMNVNAGVIQSNTSNLLVQTIAASNANVVLSANGTANVVLTNTGNLQLTSGNLVTTYNVYTGNLIATQNLSAGNLSLTTLSISANLSNAGNILVTQNVIAGNIQVTNNIANTGNIVVTQGTFTRNLTISQNTSAGNITTANINVSAIANIAALIAPNSATYANGTLVTFSANDNFNNTSLINIAASANGSQANLAFNVNVNAVTGLITSANTSNIVVAYSGTGATIDTRLVSGGGGGGNYQVDVYDNAGAVLTNSTVQFVNSATTNAIVTANGTFGSNIAYVVNASGLVVGTTNGAVYANGTQVNPGANINFINSATINVMTAANGSTQSNVAMNVIPQGANGAVQFNNTGTLGADANLSYNYANAQLTIAGNLSAQTVYVGTPTALPPGGLAVANTLGIYVQNIANQMFLTTAQPIANNSLVSSFPIMQQHLAYRTIYLIKPGNNSIGESIANTPANLAFTSLGCIPNVISNSITFVKATNANLFTAMAGQILGANTVAGANAGIMANSNCVWGGGGTNMGGGYFGVIRFGLAACNPSNVNVFVGLANIVAMPTAQTDWAANTAYDVIGMSCNGSVHNWVFETGTATTARTITSLGTNFPVANGDVLELSVSVQPGGTLGGYQIRNLSNGGMANGVITTNLPTANHFLNPMVQMFSGNTTVAANIALMSMYIEEDF